MTAVLRPDDPLTALRARLAPSAAAGIEVRAVGGVPLLLAALPAGLRLAFTTRHATAAEWDGPGLDLALAPPEAGPDRGVSPARGLLAEVLSPTGAGRAAGLTLVSPRQEHGVRVVGVAEYAAVPGEGCDGLTVRPPLDDGLAALLLFADCVPVVMVGEVDAAVVHGGWRGLMNGVVQQGARVMTGPPGAAYIGPSIGPCCFTVGDDVAADFERRYGAGVVLPGPRVDLWEVTERALAEVEVPRARVTNPRLCTRCNSDLFYSYRVEGADAGRQGAVVWTAAERRR